MAKGGKKAKTKNRKKEAERVKREVAGVIIAAVGLFLCAGLYSSAVGILGKAIGGFIFGAFGFLGYAVPVAIVAAGILYIVFAENSSGGATTALVIIAVVSVLSILHIATRGGDIENTNIIAYYADAYSLGKVYREGGGIIGALPAYPALLLLGQIGAYILFVACVMVAFLLITKVSLKSAGKKLGESIRTGVAAANEKANERAHESAKQQVLYTENITEDLITGKNILIGKEKKTEKKKKGTSLNDSMFTIEPADEIYTADQGFSAKQQRNYAPDPEFMPTKGEIKRKAAEKAVEEAFDTIEEEYIEDMYTQAERINKNAPEISQDIPREQTPFELAHDEQAANAVTAEETDGEILPATMPVLEYQRPPYNLLNAPARDCVTGSESPQEKAKLLIETLATFNIPAKIINISVGPVITRFELQPAQGIRVNRITSLSQDIALALAAPLVRIEAPIPGKAAIGIEVPNKNAATVLLREVIESKEFESERSPIAFALGKDIAGRIICANLEKMPHLLIAGATGSGKSVCMNDIILSMAYKSSPAELRLVLIDPKVVEMRVYAPLPHLMLPVVTDPKKAAGALKWAVMEMEQRYQKMAKLNARDLARYNALVEDESEKLPKLVVVIDELADLMMVAAKDVEESICRIAQLGRAAGVHLLVATQRPSTDVITGLIKANIPSRIAFMVSSGVDSRVILDESGAEKLLGKGDMLFHANGASKPIRAQAAFVSDEEVERVMDFFAQTSAQPPIEEDAFERITAPANAAPSQGNGKQEDELLPEAVRIVIDSGQASISMIQRRLRVGYARAARLIDIMEQQKIVSGFDGSKPRKLLIDRAGFEARFGSGYATVSQDEIADKGEDEQYGL